MANSQSFFDYLGPDILTDLLQYLFFFCESVFTFNKISLNTKRYLDVADVIAFSQVCKNFHFFTTGNRAVWKGLFWRRYGKVYSSYPERSHSGLGGSDRAWEKVNVEGGPLVSCDSFDDWRDSLMGKMAEERGWRVGQLSFKELRGHNGDILNFLF
jgi:hypothetical protein